MRPLIVFVAALAFAGCDAVETDPDAAPHVLVGRWAATETTETVFATSRVAQDVPDYSAPVGGGIVVSGYVDLTLDAIVELSHRQVVIDTDLPNGERLPGLALRNSRDRWTLYFSPADVAPVLTSFKKTWFDGTTPFTYADGRLTIPEMELTTLGTSTSDTVRVRLGGTLEIPSISLRPGIEARVFHRTGPPDRHHAYTFAEDGTVIWEYPAFSGDGTESAIGAWDTAADGSGTLRFGEYARSFHYAVQNGALTLTYDEPIPPDIVGHYEGQALVQYGSFEAVRTVHVDAYRAER